MFKTSKGTASLLPSLRVFEKFLLLQTPQHKAPHQSGEVPAGPEHPTHTPSASGNSSVLAPPPAEALEQPPHAPCCNSTVDQNGTAAARHDSATLGGNSTAVPGKESTAPVRASESDSATGEADSWQRKMFRWARQYDNWIGRLGMLGLALLSAAAVMCWRWSRRRDTRGYTELAETKVQILQQHRV